MMPDLGQRLTAALDEMQSLGASDVERYLRALRATDPELAGRLCALLNLPRSNSAGPTALGAERGPSSVVPLPDPDVRGPIPLGEPTASVNAPATASFPPPGHEGRGPAGRGTILNRHQLLEVVGRGAFGEVWKAFDPVLQKHVAVKVSRPDRPTPVAAFLDEARKVALLPRHPAIVQVYDVGASPDGWYIVSEFIDGESLRDRAAAGRLPFEQAARVVATVAGALHAAHLAGLVHRDVKPGNILLDRTGNAYLTDFGLAVREEDQSAERSKVSGTLAYMPPEQISGDTHLLDGRADVYALGAVLYELLTGRMVFRAADVDEYREQILRREPRPPRAIDAAVPEELERVCLKCLAKEVKDRYRTARDVAIELEAWLAGSARSPDPAPRARWKSVAVGAAAVALVALVAGGIATLGGGTSAPTPPERPGAVVPPVAVPLGIASPPQKVRAVQELVWRSTKETSKWDVIAETNQLKVYTDSVSLLQLGEAKAQDWTFSAHLQQLRPIGQIGLFFGYRTNPEAGTAHFELISLDLINEFVEVRRIQVPYSLDKRETFPGGCVVAGALRAKADPGNTFRIVVRNNVLSEVRVNGEALPALLSLQNGKGPYPAAGGFGVYNRMSDGIFSDPRFNGNPIPLLVDPVALTPERP